MIRRIVFGAAAVILPFLLLASSASANPRLTVAVSSFSFSAIVPIGSAAVVIAPALMGLATGISVIAVVALGVRLAYGFLKGRVW